MKLFTITTTLLLVGCMFFVHGHAHAHDNNDHNHEHHNHHHHHHHHHRELQHERGKCGTKSPSTRDIKLSKQIIDDFQKRQRADARSVQTNFTFETHVYVITNSEGVGNVSDEVIEFNMGLLNEGFSGNLTTQGTDCDGDAVSGRETNIRFNLTSINRVTNDEWFDVDIADFDTQEEMGIALRTGGCDVLNVYVYGSQEVSFATMPDECHIWTASDGIWLANFELIGHEASLSDDVGDTLVHEAGHWAGLHHVFEGGCSNTEGGDLVEDTPPQEENFGGCPANRDSCVGGGLDSIHNYMDYTDYCCIHEFSEGQITRMHALLEKYRSGGNVTFDDDNRDDDNRDDYYDDYYDCKTGKGILSKINHIIHP